MRRKAPTKGAGRAMHGSPIVGKSYRVITVVASIILYLMWIMLADTLRVSDRKGVFMAIDAGAVGLIINGVSSLASTGVGVYNSIMANKNAKKQNEYAEDTYQLNRDNALLNRENLEWNKEKSNRDFEYNKQLQERIFQREDSAVQRMVADNRAAGLSPIAGLAGSGTGQALEANTPQLGQVSQNLAAPQFSANQILTDFSSLSQLGNNITNYQHNKDALALQQQKLDLEKSSNELNLKLMEQQIQSSQIKNQVARATIDDDIAGKKLSNQRAEKEIARIGVDIMDKVSSVNGKNILNARSQYELDELKANRDLRDRMGEKQFDNLCSLVDNNKMSLAQKTSSIAVMLATEERASQMYGTQLATLMEEYAQLVEEGQQKYGLKRSLESVGMDSQAASNWQTFFDKLSGLLPTNISIGGR